MEAETQLPLTNPANCIQVDNVLDLSKSYFVLADCKLNIQTFINAKF